jgi:curli production assembly/transport component CsgF
MLSGRLFAPCFLLALASPAAADMVYKPFNPSFGGDSFNSSHLQGMAGLQNEYKPKSSSSMQTNSQRFISMLESRLYSSLASQVSEAIFGENAQPSGTITFNDQTISFENNGVQIELTVVDAATGQVTHIVIPTVQ